MFIPGIAMRSCCLGTPFLFRKTSQGMLLQSPHGGPEESSTSPIFSVKQAVIKTANGVTAVFYTEVHHAWMSRRGWRMARCNKPPPAHAHGPIWEPTLERGVVAVVYWPQTGGSAPNITCIDRLTGGLFSSRKWQMGKTEERKKPEDRRCNQMAGGVNLVRLVGAGQGPWDSACV